MPDLHTVGGRESDHGRQCGLVGEGRKGGAALVQEWGLVQIAQIGVQAAAAQASPESRIVRAKLRDWTGRMWAPANVRCLAGAEDTAAESHLTSASAVAKFLCKTKKWQSEVVARQVKRKGGG